MIIATPSDWRGIQWYIPYLGEKKPSESSPSSVVPVVKKSG
jgi:hypothetical protein